MIPRVDVPCSNTISLEECGIDKSCTVAVHCKEGDILELLTLEEQVCT